jgi:dihydrofolate reductase
MWSLNDGQTDLFHSGVAGRVYRRRNWQLRLAGARRGSAGVHLHGRKTYETMAVWETPEVIPGRTPAMLDFARIWQAADKVVYSRSRATVSTPKTRLEREFHPQAVRELKAQSPLDISVAGPTLAAQAIRTGLVDEYHLLVVPTMLGGGTRVLPSNVRMTLDLLDEHRFANGMVYLRYHAPD